jgi:hypothetical protein
MKNDEKLVVLWTSSDIEVALKMVFMYTLNSKLKSWWEEVTLVVWGPSTKLLSENIEIQNYLRVIKESGVEVLACRACADEYGVTDILENKLELKVIYMGIPLTEYLKNGIKVITF